VPGHRPGRGPIWLRTPLELVDDGPTPDLVRLSGMVDAANGIAARVRPGTGSWMFPNVDLQLHFHRLPSGAWLGPGHEGDLRGGRGGAHLQCPARPDGPFGRSEQILTVRPL
jgi:hypothetical protein